MPVEESPADLIALLDDEYARAILAATDQQPMSAPELAEACDASRPTVYRRIDRLKEFDLVEESMRADEHGHHHCVYEARFSRLSIELTDGEYRIQIDRRDDPADRFTQLWEGL